MKKEKQVPSTNYTFDRIKAVSCIFIILIHCKFPGVFGDLCEALARFGVPMFFAIAGYYLLKDENDSVPEIRTNMARKLKKTSLITLKVWLIYTIYSFIYSMSVNYGIKEWFSEKFNLFEFSRLVFFNSGKFIYDFTYAFDHLWYLFALIYVYGLIYIFAPFLKKGAKPISIVLLAFLFIGELLKIYYPIRPFGINISVWYVIRNWLFVGIPFTFLGFWMRQDKVAGMLNKPPTLAALLVITGVFSTFMEYRKWGTEEVYFGSLIIVVGLLIFGNMWDVNPFYKIDIKAFLDKEDSVKNGGEEKLVSSTHHESKKAEGEATEVRRTADRKNYRGNLAWAGKHLSANVYFYHVMIISAFGWCVDRIFPDAYGSSVFMTIRPIVVITITILISLLINKSKFITTKK